MSDLWELLKIHRGVHISNIQRESRKNKKEEFLHHNIIIFIPKPIY